MIDGREYKCKSKQLKALLKDIYENQADTANRAENSYEFATKTFEKLANANEKFMAGSVHDNKSILLAIVQNPVLYEGKLQITPYEWLEPVKMNIKSIRKQSDER